MQVRYGYLSHITGLLKQKTVIYWDYYTNIKVEVHYKKLKQSCTFLGFQEN